MKFFAIENSDTISVVREDQSKPIPIVESEEPINIDELEKHLKTLDN